MLLAADIDKETLIKYLDRFLVFYIRTADRLEAHLDLVQQVRGGAGLFEAGDYRRFSGNCG